MEFNEKNLDITISKVDDAIQALKEKVKKPEYKTNKVLTLWVKSIT